MRTESHNEKIICPECGSVETATVEHTVPWYSYVHTCRGCGYVIMESEWQRANKNNCFVSRLRKIVKGTNWHWNDIENSQYGPVGPDGCYYFHLKRLTRRLGTRRKKTKKQLKFLDCLQAAAEW